MPKSQGWELSPLIEMFERVAPESVLDPDQQQSLLYASDLELDETIKADLGVDRTCAAQARHDRQPVGKSERRRQTGQDRGATGGPGTAMKVSARLILVDDANAVREVTAATLRALSYTVREVGSGGAALELLERGGSAVPTSI